MGLLNYKPIRRSDWKFLKISVRKRNCIIGFKSTHSKPNLSLFKTLKAEKEKIILAAEGKRCFLSLCLRFLPKPFRCAFLPVF